MILLDQEQQHTKAAVSSGRILRSPERAVSRPSSILLPDYETSQALHDSSSWTRKPGARRRCLNIQLWKAALIALVIYLIITIGIGLPLILRKFSNQDKSIAEVPFSRLTQVNWEDNDLDGDLILLAISEDIVCNMWDTLNDEHSLGRLTAKRKFAINSNGILSFRSNATGTIMYGSFTVASNPDIHEKNPLLLLEAFSFDPRFRNGIHVCYNTSDLGRGFDIFVPEVFSPYDLSLDIRILFPVNLAPRPSLQKMSTSMPLFLQHLEDLSSALSLKIVSLQGVRSTTLVDAIIAEQVAIKSSSAAISGSFNISQSLNLDTIRGSIDANVTLFHDSTNGPQQILLTMETGNSDLNADILLQAAGRAKPPAFIADLRTFNAPINVNITHHPSTSPMLLYLRAETSGAASNISVDSKYSGWFDVQSKMSTTSVQTEKNTSNASYDPAGLNRPREYNYTRRSQERTQGWVGWGNMPSTSDQSKVGYLEILSLLDTASLRFVEAVRP